jgi:calcineurin-like phosphoesterase family protein
MNNSWFSGCLHLGHETILKGFRGKFFENIEEHDNTIINNIFSNCKPGDNYYCLGDIFWKIDSEKKKKFFDDIRKHKINFFWIVGNHDKPFSYSGIIQWTYMKDIIVEKQPITLCHYPMVVWNKSHYGAWNLHAHIHFNDATYQKMGSVTAGKRLNVGVEFHDFQPFSFEEIKERIHFYPDNFDLIKRSAHYG